MMRGFLFLITFIFAISISAKTKWHQWNAPELNNLKISLNPIQLSNRAACAIDSKKPTESMFVFLNNTVTAKAAYRLANRTGQDRTLVTKELIKDFRNKTIILLREIHERLFNQTLPLLPYLDSKANIPVKYKEILNSCFGSRECPKLQRYLEGIWFNTHKEKHRLYDSFNEDDNYITTKYIKGDNTLECVKVKKFGSLQANLFGQKPKVQDLNTMAKELINIKDSISECQIETTEEISNLQVAGYQLDIHNIKASYWKNDIGFDYWNSVKIYFAWAMKNLDIVSPKYEQIIKNSNTQDYILFTPNGCKSDIMPSCNNKRLAENSFREFSRGKFQKDALELDILSTVPEGVQEDILKNPFANVNNDILDIANYGDADDWIEHIFKNQNGTKNYVKNQLVESLTFFSLIKNRLSPEEVKSQLEFYYRHLDNNIIKNDLYYLCAESAVISDEVFSFTKKHIEGLKETSLIDDLNLIFTNAPYFKIVDYYQSLMLQTREFCEDLRQKDIFDNSFEVNYSGYEQWYLDKIRGKNEVESKSEEHYQQDALSQDFIKYNGSDEVICRSISHCLRKSIISIIETARATYYGDLFWKSKYSQSSADIFNPYSERMACKVYDPYYKTKAIMTQFISDIGQGLMSWFTPGVLYTKIHLEPGHVTSFEKMIKDGQIQYNTKYEKEKINVEIITELGPLIGVPCAVSYTGSNKSPTNLYHFKGISVGACYDRKTGDVIANSGSDVNTNDPDGLAACAACRINFEGISNALTYFNTMVGPFFYVARALYSLYKGLTDFDNIPRRWNLDLNKLKTTYQRFGEIPKRCRTTLLNGENCLENEEERAAVELMKKKSLTIIASKKTIRGHKFKVQECKNEQDVVFNNDFVRLISKCEN